jgi:osmotically-inducible protein OsmY
MEDRYNNRYRVHWGERESDPEWEERRNRSGYGYTSSSYPDRERQESNGGSDYENRRYSENDYEREPHLRRGEYRGERGFREAPEGYTGRNTYTSATGYRSHVEGRSQSNPGYGETPMGATWGSELGRHRLGSLTESAGYGVRRILREREARYSPEAYGHAGRGPKGYQRSDERITEDVNEQLTRDPEVDATDIDVRVDSGIVTLSGTVNDRQSKRVAEDIANDVWGVKDVQNQIRVHRQEAGSVGDASQPAGKETGQTSSPQVAGHSAASVTHR